MPAGRLPLLSRVMGEPMEMTAIIAALLAAAGGLVVLAACGLRCAAAHRQGLLAAGAQVADRLHLRWLAGIYWIRDVWARSRRPARLFGMTAALGLVLIAAVAIGAGQLVEDATAGDGIAVLDHPVAGFVAAHRAGWLTAVMRVVSAAGGPLVLAAAAASVSCLLGLLRRTVGPVLLAGVTVAGTGGLTIMLKEALGRSRPPLDQALAAADGHAFPSAHAATAAAVFGILAYLCATRFRSWSARVAVWAGAAVLTALVGISRVYLGVHWITDVIGGWAFGVVWLAVVLTGWTILTRHRRSQPEIPGPDSRGDLAQPVDGPPDRHGPGPVGRTIVPASASPNGNRLPWTQTRPRIRVGRQRQPPTPSSGRARPRPPASRSACCSLRRARQQGTARVRGQQHPRRAAPRLRSRLPGRPGAARRENSADRPAHRPTPPGPEYARHAPADRRRSGAGGAKVPMAGDLRISSPARPRA